MTFFGQPQFADINAAFATKLSPRAPQILVHRGSANGTIVENTLKAIQAAVAQGGDIVEIDVIRSADGQFYLFHNGYEKMHFGLEEDILTLSSSELDQLQYEWAVQRSAEPCGLELLDTVLEHCPNTLLNIDRSWDYWDTLLDFLTEKNATDRVLLKCPAQKQYLNLLAEHPTGFPFMPIVRTLEELTLALEYRSLNTIAVEILAEDPSDELANPDIMTQLHDRNLLVLLNALNLADRRPLFLGWDDESSLFRGPEHGWGKLIAHGADIIQTDWPAALYQFRKQWPLAEQ